MTEIADGAVASVHHRLVQISPVKNITIYINVYSKKYTNYTDISVFSVLPVPHLFKLCSVSLLYRTTIYPLITFHKFIAN